MNVEMLLLVALAGVTALSTLGVLLTKDNFYAAMYMTLTLVMVATIYAFFSIEPVFVLIVFVFIGAIGIVTVAIAATYRHGPERQFSVFWAIPIVVTAAVLCYSIYTYVLDVPVYTALMTFTTHYSLKYSIENFITTEYLLLLLFMTSLAVLLMLSVVNIYRSEN